MLGGRSEWQGLCGEGIYLSLAIFSLFLRLLRCSVVGLENDSMCNGSWCFFALLKNSK